MEKKKHNIFLTLREWSDYEYVYRSTKKHHENRMDYRNWGFNYFYDFLKFPRVLIDPLFHAFTSSLFIYSCFFKKNPGTIKNRLYNAMFAGAFIYLFIEAISKLFAKWRLLEVFLILFFPLYSAY